MIPGAQRAPAGNAGKAGRRASAGSAGTNPSAENGGDAAARIPGLQRRVKRLRGKTIAAVLLAVAVFAGAVAGGSAASVSEQSIRLALGQKNYKEEGTEGPQYYAAEYKDAGELREDSAGMGRDIVREGIVLLKNENGALPLRKGAAVSVFGKAAVRPVLSSSAAVKNAKSFRTALEEEKIRVNDKLWEFMDRGGGNSFSRKVEKSLVDFSEAAIVVIGRSGSDTDLNEPAYAEPDAETAETDAETAETGAEAEVTGAKALQKTRKGSSRMSRSILTA